MRLVRTIALFLTGLIAAAALAGACAHGDIARGKLQAKYGLPASRYVELEPGLEVHYIEQGRADAPAVLLVHGFAASVHAWLPWMQQLGGDYRFIALDLPGHGLTDAPRGYRASLDGNAALVGKLADHLQLQRFVLGGNSMGGAV
jgi:alpha-beta hydrolase superfamily lysophospholipase